MHHRQGRRPLARRGLSVLGVEVDERMAEVARGHGAEVEIAAFEGWDAGGRTFDLVTCVDAWHWIDPARGAAKAGHPRTERADQRRARVWRPATGTPRFHASGAFSAFEMKTYPWVRDVSTDDWTVPAATITSG
jgi:Methyltransferase domain